MHRLTAYRQSLGELATILPVSGSFTEYATRFVDPALGFALGWAYWYLWVTVLANEYNVVSQLIMFVFFSLRKPILTVNSYWSGDSVPQWALILMFWFLILGLSMLGVLVYGEVEFWLSLIKVISISLFFVIAIAISSGGIGPQKIGFKYWSDPGPFADGANGVFKIFVIAGNARHHSLSSARPC